MINSTKYYSLEMDATLRILDGIKFGNTDVYLVDIKISQPSNTSNKLKTDIKSCSTQLIVDGSKLTESFEYHAIKAKDENPDIGISDVKIPVSVLINSDIELTADTFVEKCNLCDELMINITGVYKE
jgi:hypothetical protein